MTIKQNTTDLQAILDTVNALPEAGTGLDTSDATATANDILINKTAYVNGTKITGTIPLVEQGIPDISIELDNGHITAIVSQDTGYVSGGTHTYGKYLTTQEAKTITPATTDQVVREHRWLTGPIAVQGDANLIPENIAEGVSIFGVEGTHSGGSGGMYTNAEEVYY